jgi:hypothetical protein
MPIIGDTQIQPVNFLEQYMRGQEFARGRRMNEQADQFNALKLQASEREQSNALALQQALTSGADDETLMRTPGGMSVLEARASLKEKQGTAATKDLERRIKGAEFLGQSAGAFLSLPPERRNKATIAPWVSQMTSAGLLSPEVAAYFDQMADDPAQLAQGLQLLQRQAIGAKEQAERQFINQDLGGSVRTLTAPKFGDGPAQELPGSRAVTTPSPNAPRTTVNTFLPTAENEYAKTVGKGQGEADLTAFAAAEKAAADLERDNAALDLLEQGQPATGITAPIALEFNRIIASVKGDKTAAAKVRDTELLNALLGQDVFANIQALGIGARGLDTPAEREYLREVVSGTIALNQQTLTEMARIRARMKERAIKKFNQRVSSGELDKFFKATGRPKAEVSTPVRTAPSSAAPSGGKPANVPADVWDALTAEEKKLWQKKP